MPSQSQKAAKGSRAWPKRALALFILIIAVIYALIFATGDHKATPKLGIDLQGGTRVTLVPQGANPTDEQLRQARMILENRVNGMGVSGASVVTDGNTLVITVPGEDTSQARALGQTSQLLFRPVATPAQPDTAKLLDSLEAMANRWVSIGVLNADEANTALENTSKALAKSQGKEEKDAKAPKVTAAAPETPANSIEAEAFRKKVIDTLKKDRQSTDATTQLAASSLLKCTDQPDPLQGTDEAALPLVTCDPSSGRVYVLDPVPTLIGENPEAKDAKRLTGNEIDTNRPITGGLNSQTGQMEIGFSFKSENGDQGSATWADLTQKYLQKQVAITLDSQIISAPVIQSPTPVGSATSITGSFSQQEAQELANNLKYGALPLSFAGENGESGGTTITVPASLGTASLKAGLIAGLVGLALVAAFSFYFYRFFGIISIFSLFTSFALVYGSLVLLGRWIGYSLDLAGIAGLIIGIGTTADSFVVLYERIKDEVRDGRTFRSAVPRGWERAKQTIITGNAVTLIGAVIIYILAVGDVKGFAFTLGLTTLFDIVVTFLVTAPLVIMASRKPWTAQPSANGMGKIFKIAQQREQERKLRETTVADSEQGLVGVSVDSKEADKHEGDNK
ncbi:protein translocase subunit SecD [Corynebacterium pseudotuberculosis]|uniref:Protein translocase subunit SecD n=1 Tax=Corynebacterium pseudotuberculosis 258 TaxID=1168865 RepID=A0AAU8PMH2_CORPS|nr:protein translocase subunit SecD [Corynebacterium pseudotuberculosis]AER69221.1 Protein-export membrane protein secD [Corynebacterium pseudotuberculosis 1/06-A]AEQ06726.1 protein translocase subunit SecD [Corynebacterium pseudotuberculosis CIP 52.97]AFB72525.1 protein translocase subunit SecD [Corynebacterium pseudotuberculosis 316]AFK16819.1 protein translocase subunit SecD [Corynebacterium pseudotuberculosis 258]AKS13513.1 Protein translocase subunit [Corynebacterium pseudotuberculosis]